MLREKKKTRKKKALAERKKKALAERKKKALAAEKRTLAAKKKAEAAAKIAEKKAKSQPRCRKAKRQKDPHVSTTRSKLPRVDEVSTMTDEAENVYCGVIKAIRRILIGCNVHVKGGYTKIV